MSGPPRDALDRGELRTDLLSGNPSDFDHDMHQVSPDCTMHPILPLHIECAWGEKSLKNWDSKGGANYHYEFNMLLRGWDHFLATGTSANPHGGVGFLDYRNLMSNYGRFAGSNELGRTLFPWNFNAFGRKDHGNGCDD